MILSLIIPADCYPLRFTYWGHHFYLSRNVWKYFHSCCNWCVVQIINFFFLEWYPLIETLTLWSNPTTLIWYSGIGFFTPSYWPWNAKKKHLCLNTTTQTFPQCWEIEWKWGTPVHPLSETHGQSCIHIYNDLEPTDFFFTFTNNSLIISKLAHFHKKPIFSGIKTEAYKIYEIWCPRILK